jgi:hypothetical protein
VIVAVYEQQTGRLRYLASSRPNWRPADPRKPDGDLVPPDGLGLFVLYLEPGERAEDYRWDRVARALVRRTPEPRVLIDLEELWDRFTLAELAALERQRDPAGPASVNDRAQLAAALGLLDRGREVNVTGAKVRAVVGVIVDALVADGIVDPADREDRLEALLAPVAEA